MSEIVIWKKLLFTAYIGFNYRHIVNWEYRICLLRMALLSFKPLFETDLSDFVGKVLVYLVGDGYEELEFDFGEDALESATIPKGGSRCENCTIDESQRQWKEIRMFITIYFVEQFKWVEIENFNK